MSSDGRPRGAAVAVLVYSLVKAEAELNQSRQNTSREKYSAGIRQKSKNNHCGLITGVFHFIQSRSQLREIEGKHRNNILSDAFH